MLQFCEWHAAENVRKRLAKERYKKEERDAIMVLVWLYIWSATEDDLGKNRAAMMALMRQSEQTYIEKHWYQRKAGD